MKFTLGLRSTTRFLWHMKFSRATFCSKPTPELYSHGKEHTQQGLQHSMSSASSVVGASPRQSYVVTIIYAHMHLLLPLESCSLAWFNDRSHEMTKPKLQAADVRRLKLHST